MGFFGVAQKDIRLILAKPRDLLINTAIPLVLAILFGYLFAPKSHPASKISLAVVDLDGSENSKQLIQALGREDTLKVKAMSEAKAREKIEEGKLSAAIVLPEGFGNRLNITAMFDKDKPVLSLLVDPSRQTTYQLLEGLLTKVIMERLGGELFKRESGIEQMKLALSSLDEWTQSGQDKDRWRTFFQSGIQALKTIPDEPPAEEQDESASGFRLPVEIRKEKVVRKGGRFSSYAHSFAGMLAMYLFAISVEGGVAVIDERRRGTWRRLRFSPIGRYTLLTSKVFSTFLQALFVSVVLFAIGILVFGIQISGSLVGFVAILLISSMASAGFGLMLMGLGRTEGQVRGYAMFAVLMMAFLGGAWFPHWMLPGWLQNLSMAVPTKWIMDGMYATTWRGLGLEAVWLPMLVLGGFTLGFAAIGLKTFKWAE